MDEPILEVVTQIMETGKFLKSNQSELKLKEQIEKLFKQHKKERNEESARRAYNGVVELAKLGKGELAHKYALKFEEEIGSKEIE